MRDSMPPRYRTGSELEAALGGMDPPSRIVWDFDGVIVDSEPAQAGAYRQLLEARGFVVEDGFFTDLIGRTEKQIWHQLGQRYDLREPVVDLRAERLVPVIAQLRTRAPNWFVEPILRWAENAGARSQIVSSGNREVIESYVTAWGIDGRFESISAADDRNGSKERRLTDALSAPGSVLVEDRPEYVTLADDLGAIAVGIVHSLSDDSEWTGARFILEVDP